jgi:hypothetical protein
MYTTYIYYDSHGQPYYVGKGGTLWHKRALNKQAHTVPIPPIEYIQSFTFASEFEAFECEIDLIYFFGRQCDGGLLMNQATGGPGKPGVKCSPETIAKMRQSHKGKVISKEQRMKTSRTLKGRPLSDETKRKMSASRLGKKRGPYKKKQELHDA